MQIQQVTPDDWRLWRDIRLEALASDPENFGSTLAREEAYGEDRWREMLTGGLKVVAFDPDPVGIVGAMSQPTGLMLYSMWVRDTHRGRGVGEALVKAVLTWAVDNGWKIVQLRVWDDNLPARKLYRRLGFVDSDEPEIMEFKVS